MHSAASENVSVYTLSGARASETANVQNPMNYSRKAKIRLALLIYTTVDPIQSLNTIFPPYN